MGTATILVSEMRTVCNGLNPAAPNFIQQLRTRIAARLGLGGPAHVQSVQVVMGGKALKIRVDTLQPNDIKRARG